MKAIAKRETDQPIRRDELAERAAKLQSLMVAADKNPQKLPELHAFLSENLDLAEKISVLAVSVKRGLIEKVSSSSKGTQAVLLEEVMAVTRKLTEKDASPLERLLIDCVAMCWLRVQCAEHYRTSLMGGGQSLREAELADKLLTKAHNRFIRAIESLAKLRKLNQPKSGESMDRSLKAMKIVKAMSSSG
jgi:hypothetical protein